MVGSVAEERIRAKVETALRREFADARIVHELNTEQSGVRLDLAAVRQNAITLVEIKSERDVLKRLQSQLIAAQRITGDVRVYAAEKHRKALELAGNHYLRGPDGNHVMVWSEDGRRGQYQDNPAFIPQLGRALVMIETDDGFEPLREMHCSWWPRLCLEHLADPRAQLEMLWASEFRTALSGHGVGCDARTTRGAAKRLACEHMTGGQIRRAVCAAIMGRPFARADDARAAA